MANNTENNPGSGNNKGEVANVDLELMRSFDGESTRLSGTELSERDPQAASKLEALTELGDGLRLLINSEMRESIKDETFSAMWGQIEQQIAMSAEAVQQVRSAPGEQSRGIVNAIRAWFERYRSQVLTGMASAAAAAALVWFARPPSTEVRLVEKSSPASSTSSEPLLVSAAPEVESLEVYDGSGIILTLPADGDGGAPTSVIWLLPPDNSEEGPI